MKIWLIPSSILHADAPWLKTLKDGPKSLKDWPKPLKDWPKLLKDWPQPLKGKSDQNHRKVNFNSSFFPGQFLWNAQGIQPKSQ